MSERYIEAENERWEVRLGEHPAHPNVGTIIFYPRDNQRPYRVVEVPDDRFASQDELDRLGDEDLKALFSRADIMDYVHEDDAGAHHHTERAQPLPPDVDAPKGRTRE